MELYLHLPFCVKKCAYCDFLSAPAGRGTIERYVGKLVEEIGAGGEDRPVTSVFFGGGTPTLLREEDFSSIIEALRENFRILPGAEITTEANPAAFTGEKLSFLRKLGVNRLSIGLQSADNEELKLLGRIHTLEDFLRGYEEARTAGFANVGIDLISALPGQREESWEKTLKTAVRLKPEHISAYSLIIEPGTPFYETYGAMAADLERFGEWEEIPERRRKRYEGMLRLPGEEEDRRMVRRTKEILGEAGYERYEISNYARPGFASRHNTGYWTGEDYLGLGLGAASLMDGRRFRVTDSLAEYLGCSREDFLEGRHYKEEHLLTLKERMEEFMFLGLRLTAGVREEEFSRRFGRRLSDIYGEVLDRQEKDGLIIREQGTVRFTDRGLDLSTAALSEYLLEEAPEE